MRTVNAGRWCCCAVAALAAGCTAPAPRQTQVVTMSAHAPAPVAAFPGEGGIWRLTDSEFRALGPVTAEPEPNAVSVSPYSSSPGVPGVYRGTGYITPLPVVIYSGAGFGFALGYPGYWPRHAFAPFPRYHFRAWRHRHR